ncbi:MAG: FAD-binding oxidoreductase [Geminicoccaceae bacterium]|nr:FAD-binding oxidoreductase [Geminicoccaceae bacterium]
MLKGLYDQNLYDTAAHQPSHWAATAGPAPAAPPLTGDATAEVAVVGGGFTGLMAALHLAGAGVETVLLEAGPLAWGASGRNGGFCILGGSKLEPLDLAKRHGIEAARAFFAMQRASIDHVAETAEEHGIDVERAGRGELFVAHKPGRMRGLRAWVEAVERVCGERWPVLDKAEVQARIGRTGEAEGAILIPHGFGLHPLRYAHGLAKAAQGAGVHLHPASPVVAWREEDGHHRLVTPQGSLKARRVLVATNGFPSESLRPDLVGRVLPALSTILVTRRLTEPELAAQGWTEPWIFADSRSLLYYIRLLPDRRLLFGSRGGTDAGPAAFARRVAWLTAKFRARFPAWAGVEVERAWWGPVALARSLHPHLGFLDEERSVLWAGAYHGNGVAMSGYLGRAAAMLLAGRPQPGPLPDFVRRPPPRFPVPRLRVPVLRAAYALFGLKDEVLS